MIIINIYFFLDCIRPAETVTSGEYERSVRNVIPQLQDEFDPTEDNWAQIFPLAGAEEVPTLSAGDPTISTPASVRVYTRDINNVPT